MVDRSSGEKMDVAGELKAIEDGYHELRSKYRDLLEGRKTVKRLEEECKGRVSKLKEQVESICTESQNRTAHSSTIEVMHVIEGLKEIQSTFPDRPNTLFLWLIMGDVCVNLSDRNDKVAYKQEYEKFKMVNVVIIFILSITALFSDYMLPSALVHITSVWYYFTVTLRELVLLSNGSRIRLWWLLHHYFSIVIAALFLTWPPGECYSAFRTQFMLFSCSLSLVMCLQFRHQRSKLYRQVAMGEKHLLSITQDMKPTVSNFLISCLLAIYIFQFYNGYTLFMLYFSSAVDCPHWQVPVLAVLFLILAGMNASTLWKVVGRRRHQTPHPKIEKHKSF